MNEFNQLIKKPNSQLKKKNLNLKIKIPKTNIIPREILRDDDNLNLIIIILLVILFFAFLGFIIIKNRFKSEENINLNNNDNIDVDNIFNNNNDIFGYQCNDLDPINMFEKRLKEKKIICENGSSKHICYQNHDETFAVQNGVICTMNDIILDPSKWKDGGFIYKGPVDQSNKGCPILSKGFFNMKCKKPKELEIYDQMYESYFKSWNYKYNKEKNKKIKELAPGKTIFFISRNQDSPNLYHGGSEFINTLSLVYLLKLKPENIQVVFLESITIHDDPFYDLYKNLISRGGEPIHIKNLTKKYHISSAVHIPINWDSPCFLFSPYVPTCENSTLTYKFFNDLIDKYMNIPIFRDSFESNDIFYYPKSIVKNYKSKINFAKILTFQWRRVWPKGRIGQQRILGNGPQLADKLSKLLPKNILIRLVDTARLPIAEQISILRKTDYYVGIHGAGLILSIFAPKHCILHEVLPSDNMNGLVLMASLSGHKTYSDIINSDIKTENGNELVYFDEKEFVNSVIEHMKENKLID